MTVHAERRSPVCATSLSMAAAIREAVDAEGLSNAEFARLVGATPKHVGRVLRGTDTARVSTLEQWANRLGRRWQVGLVKL